VSAPDWGPPRFDLGRVVATPGAFEVGFNARNLLGRHAAGDWGDVDAQDRRANDLAVKTGARIVSAYGEGRRRLWVITDAATDACPACHGYGGECEPGKGSWLAGVHFRDDLPARRLTTTILRPEDY
jgi:hypothetical protein